MILLCVCITGGTFVLLMFCHPPFSILVDICTNLPDFEIFIGVAIGTVTTAAFFFYIELAQGKINNELKESSIKLDSTKKQLEETNEKLEELFKAYTARTALLNLRGIFSGKDDRVASTDFERMKFLSLLKEKYIDKYSDSKESVKKVYDLARQHDLKSSHDHGNCPVCKKLIEMIISTLNDVPHPLL